MADLNLLRPGTTQTVTGYDGEPWPKWYIPRALTPDEKAAAQREKAEWKTVDIGIGDFVVIDGVAGVIKDVYPK